MMTRVELAYGHTHVGLELPAANLLGVFVPPPQMESVDEATIVRRALGNPIDCSPLRELVRPGQQVVIVTSDLTRPCPSDRLLPPVLNELSVAGVPDTDVIVVAALGLHRPMTKTELERMVGPSVSHRVQVINHNPQDTVRLGVTSRGTPVELFRPVVEADVRVCLGNLELHYFAGYSGGAKAILPGCASRATVDANHAMMVQAEAATGRIAGNPVRVDIEEGVAMVRVDFTLNVVVGPDHKIKMAVAGDVTAAHRQGCEWVARHGKFPLPQAADIVLVSAGGFPKDINLYQAQKALDNAAYALRDGGVIILLAECAEGYGNQTFQQWLYDASTPDDILARIQAEFVLGGHKAAAIASVLNRAEVFLVSEIPSEMVARGGMQSFPDAQAALHAAFRRVGHRAKIAVLPQGGSLLPVVVPQPEQPISTTRHGQGAAAN
jgi:nickel-dependent lactate racemase